MKNQNSTRKKKIQNEITKRKFKMKNENSK